MKIQFFAGLKSFFPSELVVDKKFDNVKELRLYLIEFNPASETLLNVSRFVRDIHILQDSSSLEFHDNIVVLPPSSGG